MALGSRSGHWRELFLIALPIVAIVIAAFWWASRYVQPAPPKSIAITTGGESGAYYAFGKRYAAALARDGVTLNVLASSGSVANAERMKADGNEVQLALMQGGIADDKMLPGVVSLGRMFLEPIWVFTRGEKRIERLTELSGRRIAIGPEGSGTRRLAMALLGRNGITAGQATLLPLGGQAAADALKVGDVDAAFLVFAPEAPVIQSLLRTQGIGLMSFGQADAYTRIFPYLSRVTLPQGVIDLVDNVPAEDTVLLAAQAALIAKADLHPALIALMVQAAQDIHSGSSVLHKAEEFPKLQDPEYRMSDDALRFYKSGPPLLQRHLPFWLANFLQRMIVMLVPIATILVPAVKILPKVWQWRMRRRILKWYERLKALERKVAADRSLDKLAGYRAEIDHIDDAVGRIPVPLQFTDQLYDLRAAVDLVRQRIYSLG